MLTTENLRHALAEHYDQAITPEVAQQVEHAAKVDLLSLNPRHKTPAILRQRLLNAFCGDTDALAVFMGVYRISHVWDDLIDRDKEPTAERINEAFTTALVEFNLNPFFRRHADKITPVLLTGILNWHAANDLERDGRPESLQVAYAIRCAAGDVALLMSYLAGGMDHAQQHAASLRMLTQQDTLADYLKDFDRAIQTPGL